MGPGWPRFYEKIKQETGLDAQIMGDNIACPYCLSEHFYFFESQHRINDDMLNCWCCRSMLKRGVEFR